MRFGFGEQTDVTEQGGTKKYENGHVDVSNAAQKHAVESFDGVPPRVAVGLQLIEGAGWVGEAKHPAEVTDDDEEASEDDSDGSNDEEASEDDSDGSNDE